jgi:hypothetical protein
MAKGGMVGVVVIALFGVAFAGRVEAQTPALVNAVIEGSATVHELVATTAAQCNCAPHDAAPADAGMPSVNVGSASGADGQQVTFAVSLSTAGATVAGVQNDIAFDVTNTPIAATLSGSPDCTVNPSINKEFTTFAFEPPFCVGTACTSIRALVFSVMNVDAIPDGSVLYTCNVNISPTAPAASYPLAASNVDMSDPMGHDIPSIGTDGAITVTPSGSQDSFSCYKAKDTTKQFVKTSVTVVDTYAGSTVTEFKKPFLLCDSASIAGSSQGDTAARLSCFKVKGAKLAVAQNHTVTDDFGTRTESIQKVFVVCSGAASTP